MRFIDLFSVHRVIAAKRRSFEMNFERPTLHFPNACVRSGASRFALGRLAAPLLVGLFVSVEEVNFPTFQNIRILSPVQISLNLTVILSKCIRLHGDPDKITVKLRES